MSSKMVGFLVANDIVEQIERAADERGQTTAEFLRKLVDNELNPEENRGNANMSQINPEALKSLGDWIDVLSQDIAKLHICSDCEHSLHVHRLEGLLVFRTSCVWLLHGKLQISKMERAGFKIACLHGGLYRLNG